MVEAAPSIDILKTVFPVAATKDEGTQLAWPEFFGTAFAVAAGVFMTAAHVVNAAKPKGELTICGTHDGSPMGGTKVADVELFEDFDVALLFCDMPATILNTWLARRVQVLTDLSSFGYPHAVTRENEHEHFEVVFRAYKGHVITTRGFERLKNRPPIYEMSSAYPEGMSGAPVLLSFGNQLAVAGIVLGIGNVEYGGVQQSVGVSMIADEICGLNSTLLGGPIATKLNFEPVVYGPPETIGKK